MLSYTKFGNGPLTMIAFHGFGRDAAMFKNFQYAFNSYTIYSIDLYFHGNSWNASSPKLDQRSWTLTFSEFLSKEQIDKFSLLGFSLGGKMALYTYQLFSERVESLQLMAPYGIQRNLIEILIQKAPSLYQQLQRYVDDPSHLFRLLKYLQFSRLINSTLVRIILSQLDSWPKRFRAFHTMRLYGAIKLDLPKIRHHLGLHSTKVHLYLGKYDQVLRLKTLYRHLGYLNHFSLHVLPSGHSSLPGKVINLLTQEAESLSLLEKEATLPDDVLVLLNKNAGSDGDKASALIATDTHLADTGLLVGFR